MRHRGNVATWHDTLEKPALTCEMKVFAAEQQAALGVGTPAACIMAWTCAFVADAGMVLMSCACKRNMS